MVKIRQFLHAIGGTGVPDDEELHHGAGERNTVYCAIFIALACGALFWFLDTKNATFLSVILVGGILIKYCFNRKDWQDAGVVTEQHHMNF